MKQPSLLKTAFKFMIPLGLMLSLSACIPAVFVAGAGTGLIMHDKRSVTRIMHDNDASNMVLKNIAADPELKEQTHISVSTVNQLMLIVGQATTQKQKDIIYQLASTVPKIKRIYNEVTIEPPSPISTRSNDTWITTKVKTALLAEKGLQSNDIKVVTEKGVVYLMGVVTPKQASLAANAASEVRGVKKVVKIFEYQQ